jgi:XRE family transcriptional regulator, fatty acid utilization regulator
MTRTLIGSKIRDRRRALGTTQRALAQRAGISASYLNLIESNRRSIGGGLLKRLADELEVAIDEFDGAAERRLVDDLTELATAPELAALHPEPRSAAGLAAAHPAWARALVALHRACLDRSQTVSALSDRLNQDPFLGDAVHDLLSKVTAIRSACEILESGEALEPAQRQRFLAMVGDDSRRLADVAGALASFFDKAHTSTRSVTPIEEVDDFVSEHDNHFPRLEAAAEDLRRAAGLGSEGIEPALVDWLRRRHAVQVQRVAETERAPPGPDHAARFDAAARTLLLLETAPGSTRRFELARLAGELGCGEALDAALAGSTLLGSAAAQRRARRALSSYIAGAVVLPYAPFLAAAQAARYDIDHLCRKFGASFEQVCHRLVTLRRPGAQGIRFGFMRADPAGHISKRFPLPALPLPRYGNACALWAVYRAFQTPGVLERQLAEFPNGERYLFLARAVEKPRHTSRQPRRLVSIMLACDVLQADPMLYADGLDLSSGAPATPVGQACRVCVRRDCAWRQEDPIVDAGLR